MMEQKDDGGVKSNEMVRLQTRPGGAVTTQNLDLCVKREIEDVSKDNEEVFSKVDTSIVKKEPGQTKYGDLSVYDNVPSSAFQIWSKQSEFNHDALKFDTSKPLMCNMRKSDTCTWKKCCREPLKNCNHFQDKVCSNMATNNRHGKTRKPAKPMKSAKRCDPNFKGATVVLQNFRTNHGCHLKISAQFSNLKTFSLRKKRERCGSGSDGSVVESLSGSDEENSRAFTRETLYAGKTCASCGTRRTPLWRDAEDGTPLCNACGIRFKKYRVRCSMCWHIPKKDIKSFPNCPLCGSLLRISVARRSPW